MSPVTLQVVQDSPSGYLMSSGAPTLFWRSLKTRRDEDDGEEYRQSRCHEEERRDDPSGGSDTSGRCSTSDSAYPQSTSSASSESGAQSSQSSSTSCSTTITPTTSITVGTSATGSRPASRARASTSPLSTSASSPIESSSPSTGLSTQPKSHNKGAIIGGVVGGVVILSIAALILFVFLRRRRRMKHTAPSAEFLHPNSPFQRLNTARSGSPTRTRSVFDMLPSPNNGDAGRKSLLRSLSRRDYKAPPTLEKVTVHTTSAVHAL